MLDHDETGHRQTIEDIFHDLSNRLLEVKYLIERQKEISPTKEDIMVKIRENITAYPYDKALAKINVKLTKIEDLITILKDRQGNFIVKGPWGDKSFRREEVEKLIEELEKYKTELLFLDSNVRENQTIYLKELANIEFPKIETNLTVEQIGGLLYFLLKHQNDIIITDAAKTCRIFSKVLTTKKSSNLSEDYLYNMMLKTPRNIEITKFWKDKFKSF